MWQKFREIKITILGSPFWESTVNELKNRFPQIQYKNMTYIHVGSSTCTIYNGGLYQKYLICTVSYYFFWIAYPYEFAAR